MYYMHTMKQTIAIAIWIIGIQAQAQVIVRGNQPAPWRGVYEVVLTSKPPSAQPFQPGLVQVTFTQPNGTDVTVDAFYDGGSLFKARAYCEHTGDWTWRCSSRDTTLKGKHGCFTVIESKKVYFDVLPSVNRKGIHWLLRSHGQYFLTGSCRFLLPTANAVRLTGNPRLPDG